MSHHGACHYLAAAGAAAAALMITTGQAASAAPAVPGQVPGTAAVTGITMHDTTSGMQSMARTSATGTWVIAQVTQSGRGGLTRAQHAARGDLTLSHVSGGRTVSWMYLHGFGHGESIAIQPDPGGFWVWAEARATLSHTPFPGDAFGTQVARFRWRSGATITPSAAGVQVFSPVPGSYYMTPSLDLADGLIGIRYADAAGAVHVITYDLAAFTARSYVPVTRTGLPPPGGTDQGWALLPGRTTAVLTGDHYTAANPPPGDTVITWYDTAGKIAARAADHVAAGDAYREPEGLTTAAGLLCSGFTSGGATARRASIYC
jgi:hypothetical protein